MQALSQLWSSVWGREVLGSRHLERLKSDRILGQMVKAKLDR